MVTDIVSNNNGWELYLKNKITLLREIPPPNESLVKRYEDAAVLSFRRECVRQASWEQYPDPVSLYNASLKEPLFAKILAHECPPIIMTSKDRYEWYYDNPTRRYSDLMEMYMSVSNPKMSDEIFCNGLQDIIAFAKVCKEKGWYLGMYWENWSKPIKPDLEMYEQDIEEANKDGNAHYAEILSRKRDREVIVYDFFTEKMKGGKSRTPYKKKPQHKVKKQKG